MELDKTNGGLLHVSKDFIDFGTVAVNDIPSYKTFQLRNTSSERKMLIAIKKHSYPIGIQRLNENFEALKEHSKNFLNFYNPLFDTANLVSDLELDANQQLSLLVWFRADPSSFSDLKAVSPPIMVTPSFQLHWAYEEHHMDATFSGSKSGSEYTEDIRHKEVIQVTCQALVFVSQFLLSSTRLDCTISKNKTQLLHVDVTNMSREPLKFIIRKLSTSPKGVTFGVYDSNNFQDPKLNHHVRLDGTASMTFCIFVQVDDSPLPTGYQEVLQFENLRDRRNTVQLHVSILVNPFSVESVDIIACSADKIDFGDLFRGYPTTATIEFSHLDGREDVTIRLLREKLESKLSLAGEFAAPQGTFSLLDDGAEAEEVVLSSQRSKIPISIQYVPSTSPSAKDSHIKYPLQFIAATKSDRSQRLCIICLAKLITSGIKIIPEEVNFGDCIVGQSKRQTFYIENPSSIPTTVAIELRSKIITIEGRQTAQGNERNSEIKEVFTVPPTARLPITLQISPQRINPTYRKEITITDTRTTLSNSHIINIEANNMAPPDAKAHNDIYMWECCLPGYDTETILQQHRTLEPTKICAIAGVPLIIPYVAQSKVERTVELVVKSTCDEITFFCFHDPLKADRVEALSAELRLYCTYDSKDNDGAKGGRTESLNPESLQSLVDELYHIITKHGKERTSFKLEGMSCLKIFVRICRKAQSNEILNKEDGLYISVDGVDIPSRFVRLSYRLCGTHFEVSEQHVKNFGEINIGTKKATKVSVANNCQSVLYLRITKSHSATAGFIRISGNEKQEIFLAVRPYATKEVELTFSAGIRGNFEEKIKFLNILRPQNTYTMTLKANVIKIDTFEVSPDSWDCEPFNVPLAGEPPYRNGVRFTVSNISKTVRYLCFRFLPSNSSRVKSIPTSGVSLASRHLTGAVEASTPETASLAATTSKSNSSDFFLFSGVIVEFSLTMESIGANSGTARRIEEEIEKLDQKIKIYQRKNKLDKLAAAKERRNLLQTQLNGGDVENLFCGEEEPATLEGLEEVKESGRTGVEGSGTMHATNQHPTTAVTGPGPSSSSSSSRPPYSYTHQELLRLLLGEGMPLPAMQAGESVSVLLRLTCRRHLEQSLPARQERTLSFCFFEQSDKEAFRIVPVYLVLQRSIEDSGMASRAVMDEGRDSAEEPLSSHHQHHHPKRPPHVEHTSGKRHGHGEGKDGEEVIPIVPRSPKDVWVENPLVIHVEAEGSIFASPEFTFMEYPLATLSACAVNVPAPFEVTVEAVSFSTGFVVLDAYPCCRPPGDLHARFQVTPRSGELLVGVPRRLHITCTPFTPGPQKYFIPFMSLPPQGTGEEVRKEAIQYLVVSLHPTPGKLPFTVSPLQLMFPPVALPCHLSSPVLGTLYPSSTDEIKGQGSAGVGDHACRPALQTVPMSGMPVPEELLITAEVGAFSFSPILLRVRTNRPAQLLLFQDRSCSVPFQHLLSLSPANPVVCVYVLFVPSTKCLHTRPHAFHAGILIEVLRVEDAMRNLIAEKNEGSESRKEASGGESHREVPSGSVKGKGREEAPHEGAGLHVMQSVVVKVCCPFVGSGEVVPVTPAVVLGPVASNTTSVQAHFTVINPSPRFTILVGLQSSSSRSFTSLIKINGPPTSQRWRGNTARKLGPKRKRKIHTPVVNRLTSFHVAEGVLPYSVVHSSSREGAETQDGERSLWCLPPLSEVTWPAQLHLPSPGLWEDCIFMYNYTCAQPPVRILLSALREDPYVRCSSLPITTPPFGCLTFPTAVVLWSLHEEEEEVREKEGPAGSRDGDLATRGRGIEEGALQLFAPVSYTVTIQNSNTAWMVMEACVEPAEIPLSFSSTSVTWGDEEEQQQQEGDGAFKLNLNTLDRATLPAAPPSSVTTKESTSVPPPPPSPAAPCRRVSLPPQSSTAVRWTLSRLPPLTPEQLALLASHELVTLMGTAKLYRRRDPCPPAVVGSRTRCGSTDTRCTHQGTAAASTSSALASSAPSTLSPIPQEEQRRWQTSSDEGEMQEMPCVAVVPYLIQLAQSAGQALPVTVDLGLVTSDVESLDEDENEEDEIEERTDDEEEDEKAPPHDGAPATRPKRTTAMEEDAISSDALVGVASSESFSSSVRPVRRRLQGLPHATGVSPSVPRAHLPRAREGGAITGLGKGRQMTVLLQNLSAHVPLSVTVQCPPVIRFATDHWVIPPGKQISVVGQLQLSLLPSDGPFSYDVFFVNQCNPENDMKVVVTGTYCRQFFELACGGGDTTVVVGDALQLPPLRVAPAGPTPAVIAEAKLTITSTHPNAASCASVLEISVLPNERFRGLMDLQLVHYDDVTKPVHTVRFQGEAAPTVSKRRVDKRTALSSPSTPSPPPFPVSLPLPPTAGEVAKGLPTPSRSPCKPRKKDNANQKEATEQFSRTMPSSSFLVSHSRSPSTITRQQVERGSAKRALIPLAASMQERRYFTALGKLDVLASSREEKNSTGHLTLGKARQAHRQEERDTAVEGGGTLVEGSEQEDSAASSKRKPCVSSAARAASLLKGNEKVEDGGSLAGRDDATHITGTSVHPSTSAQESPVSHPLFGGNPFQQGRGILPLRSAAEVIVVTPPSKVVVRLRCILLHRARLDKVFGGFVRRQEPPEERFQNWTMEGLRQRYSEERERLAEVGKEILWLGSVVFHHEGAENVEVHVSTTIEPFTTLSLSSSATPSAITNTTTTTTTPPSSSSSSASSLAASTCLLQPKRPRLPDYRWPPFVYPLLDYYRYPPVLASQKRKASGGWWGSALSTEEEPDRTFLTGIPRDPMMEHRQESRDRVRDHSLRRGPHRNGGEERREVPDARFPSSKLPVIPPTSLSIAERYENDQPLYHPYPYEATLHHQRGRPEGDATTSRTLSSLVKAALLFLASSTRGLPLQGTRGSKRIQPRDVGVPFLLVSPPPFSTGSSSKDVSKEYQCHIGDARKKKKKREEKEPCWMCLPPPPRPPSVNLFQNCVEYVGQLTVTNICDQYTTQLRLVMLFLPDAMSKGMKRMERNRRDVGDSTRGAPPPPPSSSSPMSHPLSFHQSGGTIHHRDGRREVAGASAGHSHAPSRWAHPPMFVQCAIRTPFPPPATHAAPQGEGRGPGVTTSRVLHVDPSGTRRSPAAGGLAKEEWEKAGSTAGLRPTTRPPLVREMIVWNGKKIVTPLLAAWKCGPPTPLVSPTTFPRCEAKTKPLVSPSCGVAPRCSVKEFTQQSEEEKRKRREESRPSACSSPPRWKGLQKTSDEGRSPRMGGEKAEERREETTTDAEDRGGGRAFPVMDFYLPPAASVQIRIRLLVMPSLHHYVEEVYQLQQSVQQEREKGFAPHREGVAGEKKEWKGVGSGGEDKERRKRQHRGSRPPRRHHSDSRSSTTSEHSRPHISRPTTPTGIPHGGPLIAHREAAHALERDPSTSPITQEERPSARDAFSWSAAASSTWSPATALSVLPSLLEESLLFAVMDTQVSCSWSVIRLSVAPFGGNEEEGEDSAEEGIEKETEYEEEEEAEGAECITRAPRATPPAKKAGAPPLTPSSVEGVSKEEPIPGTGEVVLEDKTISHEEVFQRREIERKVDGTSTAASRDDQETHQPCSSPLPRVDDTVKRGGGNDKETGRTLPHGGGGEGMEEESTPSSLIPLGSLQPVTPFTSAMARHEEEGEEAGRGRGLEPHSVSLHTRRSSTSKDAVPTSNDDKDEDDKMRKGTQKDTEAPLGSLSIPREEQNEIVEGGEGRWNEREPPQAVRSTKEDEEDRLCLQGPTPLVSPSLKEKNGAPASRNLLTGGTSGAEAQRQRTPRKEEKEILPGSITTRGSTLPFNKSHLFPHPSPLLTLRCGSAVPECPGVFQERFSFCQEEPHFPNIELFNTHDTTNVPYIVTIVSQSPQPWFLVPEPEGVLGPGQCSSLHLVLQTSEVGSFAGFLRIANTIRPTEVLYLRIKGEVFEKSRREDLYEVHAFDGTFFCLPSYRATPRPDKFSSRLTAKLIALSSLRWLGVAHPSSPFALPLKMASATTWPTSDASSAFLLSTIASLVFPSSFPSPSTTPAARFLQCTPPSLVSQGVPSEMELQKRRQRANASGVEEEEGEEVVQEEHKGRLPFRPWRRNPQEGEAIQEDKSGASSWSSGLSPPSFSSLTKASLFVRIADTLSRTWAKTAARGPLPTTSLLSPPRSCRWLQWIMEREGMQEEEEEDIEEEEGENSSSTLFPLRYLYGRAHRLGHPAVTLRTNSQPQVHIGHLYGEGAHRSYVVMEIINKSSIALEFPISVVMPFHLSLETLSPDVSGEECGNWHRQRYVPPQDEDVPSSQERNEMTLPAPTTKGSEKTRASGDTLGVGPHRKANSSVTAEEGPQMGVQGHTSSWSSVAGKRVVPTPDEKKKGDDLETEENEWTRGEMDQPSKRPTASLPSILASTSSHPLGQASTSSSPPPSSSFASTSTLVVLPSLQGSTSSSSQSIKYSLQPKEPQMKKKEKQTREKEESEMHSKNLLPYATQQHGKKGRRMVSYPSQRPPMLLSSSSSPLLMYPYTPASLQPVFEGKLIICHLHAVQSGIGQNNIVVDPQSRVRLAVVLRTTALRLPTMWSSAFCTCRRDEEDAPVGREYSSSTVVPSGFSSSSAAPSRPMYRVEGSADLLVQCKEVRDSQTTVRVRFAASPSTFGIPEVVDLMPCAIYFHLHAIQASWKRRSLHRRVCSARVGQRSPRAMGVHRRGPLLAGTHVPIRSHTSLHLPLVCPESTGDGRSRPAPVSSLLVGTPAGHPVDMEGEIEARDGEGAPRGDGTPWRKADDTEHTARAVPTWVAASDMDYYLACVEVKNFLCVEEAYVMHTQSSVLHIVEGPSVAMAHTKKKGKTQKHTEGSSPKKGKEKKESDKPIMLVASSTHVVPLKASLPSSLHSSLFPTFTTPTDWETEKKGDGDDEKKNDHTEGKKDVQVGKRNVDETEEDTETSEASSRYDEEEEEEEEDTAEERSPSFSQLLPPLPSSPPTFPSGGSLSHMAMLSVPAHHSGYFFVWFHKEKAASVLHCDVRDLPPLVEHATVYRYYQPTERMSVVLHFHPERATRAVAEAAAAVTSPTSSPLLSSPPAFRRRRKAGRHGAEMRDREATHVVRHAPGGAAGHTFLLSPTWEGPHAGGGHEEVSPTRTTASGSSLGIKAAPLSSSSQGRAEGSSRVPPTALTTQSTSTAVEDSGMQDEEGTPEEQGVETGKFHKKRAPQVQHHEDTEREPQPLPNSHYCRPPFLKRTSSQRWEKEDLGTRRRWATGWRMAGAGSPTYAYTFPSALSSADVAVLPTTTRTTTHQMTDRCVMGFAARFTSTLQRYYDAVLQVLELTILLAGKEEESPAVVSPRRAQATPVFPGRSRAGERRAIHSSSSTKEHPSFEGSRRVVTRGASETQRDHPQEDHIQREDGLKDHHEEREEEEAEKRVNCPSKERLGEVGHSCSSVSTSVYASPEAQRQDHLSSLPTEQHVLFSGGELNNKPEERSTPEEGFGVLAMTEGQRWATTRRSPSPMMAEDASEGKTPLPFECVTEGDTATSMDRKETWERGVDSEGATSHGVLAPMKVRQGNKGKEGSAPNTRPNEGREVNGEEEKINSSSPPSPSPCPPPSTITTTAFPSPDSTPTRDPFTGLDSDEGEKEEEEDIEKDLEQLLSAIMPDDAWAALHRLWVDLTWVVDELLRFTILLRNSRHVESYCAFIASVVTGHPTVRAWMQALPFLPPHIPCHLKLCQRYLEALSGLPCFSPQVSKG